MSAESSCNRASQTCCERIFPKHGDENNALQLLIILSSGVKEYSPNMGTKTELKLSKSTLSMNQVKEYSPNMGTKTTIKQVEDIHIFRIW